MFRGKSRSLQEFKKRKQQQHKTKKKSAQKKAIKLLEKKEVSGPTKPWQHFSKGLKWSLVFGTVLGIIYVIFYSPIFMVQHIIVEANGQHQVIEQSTNNALEGRQYNLFFQRSMVTVSKQKIIDNILQDHETLSEVQVAKRWPNIIKITAQEKKVLLIWQLNEQQFDIGGGGIALRESTTPTAEHPIPLVVDERKDATIAIGERVISEQFLTFAKELPETMKKYTRLNIEKLSTPNPNTRELHVETREGWRLILDTARSPVEEMKTLNKIVEEKLTKEELENIEYIDLRIKEKTFYKFK